MSSAKRRLVIVLPPMLTVPSWSSKASVMILSRNMLKRVGESRHPFFSLEFHWIKKKKYWPMVPQPPILIWRYKTLKWCVVFNTVDSADSELEGELFSCTISEVHHIRGLGLDKFFRHLFILSEESLISSVLKVVRSFWPHHFFTMYG